MRTNIVHPGASELHYEIRGIVEFAEQLERAGVSITWENIGDPIAKGEEVPEWIRNIVADEARKSSATYGYSPTKGLNRTRDFLSRVRSQETGTVLGPENIVFFNGLGDAINKTYTWLNPTSRVLGPSPAYPTHSSVEAAHGRAHHLTYKLDPANDWLPDTDEVRALVHDNPVVAGLLIINPDNPTGMLYPRETLKEFVAIAEEYDLLLIADEIYANLTYQRPNFTSLAEVSRGVPTIVMRGLSKEVPWPGSRCGWLEFYNVDRDEQFRRYVQSIVEAKMTEVSSTTVPQAVLPAILGDKRYGEHLERRRQKYARRAAQAKAILDSHPILEMVEPQGAFYLSVTFRDKAARHLSVRPAANPEAQKLLDAALKQIPETAFDKRFCHQLLAATGICVVPLSTGFNSSVPGFRMTLLEIDDDVFTATLQTIKEFCGAG